MEPIDDQVKFAENPSHSFDLTPIRLCDGHGHPPARMRYIYGTKLYRAANEKAKKIFGFTPRRLAQRVESTET